MYIYLYVCILLINIKFMLQPLKRSRNFIFIHNVPILCTSCNVKMSKTAPFFLNKRVETSLVLFFFTGVLFHVVPYIVTVSYRSPDMNQVPEKTL